MKRSRYVYPMRQAFTLLELVFAMIILGIVASIGAEIIANVYESYIVQRAQYRANIKTELTLRQIANRLRFAIPGTVYAVQGTNHIPITNVSNAASDGLQWVGYDYDSFISMQSGSDRKPGWSGFIDLEASSQTTLSSPGSNLAVANSVIQNLSHNTKSLSNAYVYFPDGFNTAANGSTGTEDLTVSLNQGDTIYERYKLAWSSYALTVENGDLYLYYNFSPTPKASRTQASKSLLLRNVTSFRFKGSEGSIRIKLCVNEKIGNETNDIVTSCKEKVVF